MPCGIQRNCQDPSYAAKKECLQQECAHGNKGRSAFQNQRRKKNAVWLTLWTAWRTKGFKIRSRFKPKLCVELASCNCPQGCRALNLFWTFERQGYGATICNLCSWTCKLWLANRQQKTAPAKCRLTIALVSCPGTSDYAHPTSTVWDPYPPSLVAGEYFLSCLEEKSPSPSLLYLKGRLSNCWNIGEVAVVVPAVGRTKIERFPGISNISIAFMSPIRTADRNSVVSRLLDLWIVSGGVYEAAGCGGEWSEWQSLISDQTVTLGPNNLNWNKTAAPIEIPHP